MYHILFGFDDEESVKAIIRTVKKQSGQNEIDYSIQTTKDAIQDYIRYQPDCDTLILREVMDNENWTAEELAELNDKKTYNILVVIDKKYKGGEFVKTLYTAGITNAFLMEPGTGVSPAEIAHFVINPRNRAQARKSYGIDTSKSSINILTSDVYLSKYSYLMDDTQGAGFIDRYVMIIKDFSVKMGVDFTKKLPANVLTRLAEYEEFWKVCDRFADCGFKVNIKKPKQLKKGMSDDAFRSLTKQRRSAQGRPSFVPQEYQPKKYTEDSQEPPAVEETVKSDYFDDMMTLFDDTFSPKQKEEMPREENTGVGNIEFTPDIPVVKPQVPKQVPQSSQTKKKPETVRVEVVSSPKSVLNDKEYAKQKKKREKKKTRINWKLVIGIFISAILILAIFYLILMMKNMGF